MKIFVISTHNCTHVWMRMHAWNLSEFTSSIKRTAYNRYRIELYEAFTSVCKKYKIYTPTVMKGTILSRAGLMLGFTIRTIQFRILNSTPSVSIRLSLLIQVYRIRLWNPFIIRTNKFKLSYLYSDWESRLNERYEFCCPFDITMIQNLFT